MSALTRYKSQPIPEGARSNDKAILVLLGLTGAGKTTTLNFLFDKKNITKTESYCSATSTILEYSAKISVEGDEYDLRIIDTPGFGDTRQKAHIRDARFVATFDNLLKTHEDLKCCYPTTVLLVAKFNDDRIDGETSHFIQMLRAVDTLLTNYRLLDRKYPNLVFVLTHTLSEDNQALQSDPRPKIKLIECLVKTFTNIPTPIEVVTAENKPERYNLPQLNDYYKLPNGQYYPLNLFKRIQSMAIRANDHVGETIIREAFKDPSKISMQLANEIELLPENNMMVKSILKLLQEAKFNIANTEISKEINKQWNLIDDIEKQPYFNSLQITQSTFSKRKIFSLNDLPNTIESVLKLLMDLPLNPPIISVLEAMGIVAPELPSSLGVGYFYNIFTDSVMTNSPFNLDALDYTEIGFRAARGVTAQEVGETLMFNSCFDDEKKYYADRLRQLNIINNNDMQFDLNNFTSAPKEGYNIVQKGQQGVTKLTGVSERRLFRISMNQPILLDSFKNAVAQLPEQFDVQDSQAFEAFFRANGTHIVKSIFAGGSIEVVAFKKNNTDTTAEVNTDMVLSYIREILANVGTFKPMNNDAVVEEWNLKISFRGGDSNLVKPTMANIFTPSGVTFFNKWTDSLAAHPVMLHSEIMLDSITRFLRKENASAANELKRAMNALFLVTENESPAFRKNGSVKIVNGVKLVDANPMLKNVPQDTVNQVSQNFVKPFSLTGLNLKSPNVSNRTSLNGSSPTSPTVVNQFSPTMLNRKSPNVSNRTSLNGSNPTSPSGINYFATDMEVNFSNRRGSSSSTSSSEPVPEERAQTKEPVAHKQTPTAPWKTWFKKKFNKSRSVFEKK